MKIMSDDRKFEKIDDLVNRLLVRRSTREENELCRMARLLSGEERLGVIEKLGGSNVRLAASVASRVHLPVEQQLTLISHIVSDGKSNAIKQFTIDFFVFRLSAKVIFRVLVGLKHKYPDSVKLMAYYYVSSANYVSRKDKESFSELGRR